MSGLQLVVILALLGGVTAYIGDKIGMRVGRRRLTLFGMRPRHSSIVVTIVTGILIAAFSLGVLMAASNDVRTALVSDEGDSTSPRRGERFPHCK